ncbi:MAG TPA: YHS domain-containing protein [Thermoanaerobaculia bacterium]
MKSALRIAAAVLALAAAGCDERSAAPEKPVPVQTIEDAPPRLSAIDPPPTLEERMVPTPALPAPTETAAETAAPATATGQAPPEELNAKTNLPFTPPIAMDPVDGSKVSITPDTPVFSYEDRWYYFSSAANKAAFRANPELYAKGSLSKY